MADPKKLIMLNPRFGGLISTGFDRVFSPTYPGVFAILEAMTPAEYQIVRYHLSFSVLFEPGLVAITSFTGNIYRAYAYADKFRAAGAKVVMGGPHVTFNAAEALEHCDAVCTGEAETVWAEILGDYESGALRRIYAGEPAVDFWKYYHAGFLKLKDYQLRESIQTTRGCKFRCGYCVIASHQGAPRTVPVEKVVEQIKAIKGPLLRPLVFHDPNIFSNPKYAKELFKALIPLKISWISSSTIDIAKDSEALWLAKRSGCMFLLIGFEAVEEILIQNGRPGKLHFLKEYLELVRRIRKHGIYLKGTFIIGFDEDTYATAWKLFVFSWRGMFQQSPLFVLTPFPGTPLHKKFQAEGRIVCRDWTQYDCRHAVIVPKRMSAPGFALVSVFARLFVFITGVPAMLIAMSTFMILSFIFILKVLR